MYGKKLRRSGKPSKIVTDISLSLLSSVFQGFEVDFFVLEKGEAPRFVGTAHLLPPPEDSSIHIKRAPIIGLNHRPIGEVKGFDTCSTPLSSVVYIEVSKADLYTICTM